MQGLCLMYPTFGCGLWEPSLPQAEDAALMGAMGTDMAIWLGDSHVGGQAGAEIL